MKLALLTIIVVVVALLLVHFVNLAARGLRRRREEIPLEWRGLSRREIRRRRQDQYELQRQQALTDLYNKQAPRNP